MVSTPEGLKSLQTTHVGVFQQIVSLLYSYFAVPAGVQRRFNVHLTLDVMNVRLRLKQRFVPMSSFNVRRHERN